jgi:hypothetical protein
MIKNLQKHIQIFTFQHQIFKEWKETGIQVARCNLVQEPSEFFTLGHAAIANIKLSERGDRYAQDWQSSNSYYITNSQPEICSDFVISQLDGRTTSYLNGHVILREPIDDDEHSSKRQT